MTRAFSIVQQGPAMTVQVMAYSLHSPYYPSLAVVRYNMQYTVYNAIHTTC